MPIRPCRYSSVSTTSNSRAPGQWRSGYREGPQGSGGCPPFRGSHSGRPAGQHRVQHQVEAGQRAGLLRLREIPGLGALRQEAAPEGARDSEKRESPTGKASGGAFLFLSQPGANAKWARTAKITRSACGAVLAIACPCQVAQNTRTRQGSPPLQMETRAERQRAHGSRFAGGRHPGLPPNDPCRTSIGRLEPKTPVKILQGKFPVRGGSY